MLAHILVLLRDLGLLLRDDCLVGGHLSAVLQDLGGDLVDARVVGRDEVVDPLLLVEDLRALDRELLAMGPDLRRDLDARALQHGPPLRLQLRLHFVDELAHFLFADGRHGCEGKLSCRYRIVA